MVAYDLVWQAKVSGIPYFAFDLAYDCQHVFDVIKNQKIFIIYTIWKLYAVHGTTLYILFC